MNQNIIELFKTNIYCCNLKLNLEDIKNMVLEFKNKDPKGRVLSNLSGWQSHNIIPDEHSTLTELSKSIKQHSKIYTDHLELYKDINITTMWANINEYKDSNMWHTHPQSTISGVFFVDVKENSGNIKFYNPYINDIEREWQPYMKNNYNAMNDVNTEVVPESGLLILFPSFVAHSVNPNMNQEQRISISFNI